MKNELNNLPTIFYKNGKKEQLVPENLCLKYLFNNPIYLGIQFSDGKGKPTFKYMFDQINKIN